MESRSETSAGKERCLVCGEVLPQNTGDTIALVCPDCTGVLEAKFKIAQQCWQPGWPGKVIRWLVRLKQWADAQLSIRTTKRK